MKPRIRAIRILVNTIRSNSKTKTERRIRLRMLMESCREDLYGVLYNFEELELRLISFLTIFSIIYFIIYTFMNHLNLNYLLVFLIFFSAISYRKLDIYKHRQFRAWRERSKTKKVLGSVNKKELRKLDGDLQDWYMLRSEFVNLS